jgi:hypothetical protein
VCLLCYLLMVSFSSSLDFELEYQLCIYYCEVDEAKNRLRIKFKILATLGFLAILL